MRFEKYEKKGKTFVLVPEGVFEGLMQDAQMLADIQAFDRARRQAREYFPQRVLNALLEGGHPVRVFREYRGLTQEELAKKAEIGRTNLAMIETGKKTGSVATLEKIAVALKLTIDDIVA